MCFCIYNVFLLRVFYNQGLTSREKAALIAHWKPITTWKMWNKPKKHQKHRSDGSQFTCCHLPCVSLTRSPHTAWLSGKNQTQSRKSFHAFTIVACLFFFFMSQNGQETETELITSITAPVGVLQLLCCQILFPVDRRWERSHEQQGGEVMKWVDGNRLNRKHRLTVINTCKACNCNFSLFLLFYLNYRFTCGENVTKWGANSNCVIL